MTNFEENNQKNNFWYLTPLNPRIKILFQNSSSATFFTLLTLTSCKVSEKSNEQFPRYLKTDWPTDQRTDQQANKGDYYGPHQVNPRSENWKYPLSCFEEKTKNATQTDRQGSI